MKTNNKMPKLNPYLIGLIILSFAVGILVYDHLPEKIPIHWNLEGEVDAYGNKFFGIFSLPFLTLAVYLLMIVLPRIDPKSESYAQFTGVYNVFTTLLVLFLLSLYGLVLLAAFGYQINAGLVVRLGLGILFIVLGTQLPKIKHNYFFGIKTPWTLASEDVWEKTHKVGGVLFIFAGAIIILSILFNDNVGFYITVLSILLITVFSILYSYFLYQKNDSSGA